MPAPTPIDLTERSTALGGSRKLTGHLAKPATTGPWPGVVGSYGGQDRMLKGAAAKLDVALERAGVVHDVKEYPQAGHSFLNDAENGPQALRPLMRILGIGPQPEAATDAWRRIEDFFGEHLKN